MRILFCNYEYPPLGGGGGVVMAAMAREIARRHEVTVLTSRAGDLPAESLEGDVRVVRVPVLFRRDLATANLASMAAYLPMGLRRGLALGREQSFDIVNTHFVVPTGPLGHVLARGMRVPNVLSVHGGDLFDPSKRMSPHRHVALRVAVAAMLRRADAVVAQSQDTAVNVSSIYGVQRIVDLVPLGIDRPPAGVRCNRASLSIPDDAFAMVTIGRVVPRKATTQLVRVLADLGPKAWLIVVGDGPDAGAVRQAARELGVGDRVRLLGFVTEAEKHRALAAADLFVSTSQHEGFGLVFLEAMAFGLPVVCYNRGGQVDYLSTPATGAVVRLNDVAAFTAAVRELRDAPELRATIRARNLAKVESYFIDRCAQAYESIFERTLLEHSRHLTAALPRH
ncbi:MAG TPA: glycosyltransferase family 4 protein [Steroidobacteraceae bacterium]|nr:glycosyltransferase family 4 protein [Steroidobacteraceae bacterium]